MHRARFAAVPLFATLVVEPARSSGVTPNAAAPSDDRAPGVPPAVERGAPVGLPPGAVIAPAVTTPPAEPEVTGRTPLMQAAEAGEVATVRSLLDGGADIGAADSRGWTALMYAAWAGRGDVVKLLLAKGAPVDRRDSFGATPLLRASGNGHPETATILLGAGAEVDARDNEGVSPLLPAALHGHVEVVRLLLLKGADIKVANKEGITALMAAAANGKTETVAVLLENGAEINARNNNGTTALMAAATNGLLPVLELLLAKERTPTSKTTTAIRRSALPRSGSIGRSPAPCSKPARTTDCPGVRRPWCPPGLRELGPDSRRSGRRQAPTAHVRGEARSQRAAETL